MSATGRRPHGPDAGAPAHERRGSDPPRRFLVMLPRTESQGQGLHSAAARDRPQIIPPSCPISDIGTSGQQQSWLEGEDDAAACRALRDPCGALYDEAAVKVAPGAVVTRGNR